MMHTATRVSQRQKKQQDLFRNARDQDMAQDIFSGWNVDSSVISPSQRQEKRFQSTHKQSEDSRFLHSQYLDSANNVSNLNQHRKKGSKATAATGANNSSMMHVTGAFRDHSTKPIGNRDKHRSQIRQNQLNKTQPFFNASNRGNLRNSIVEIQPQGLEDDIFIQENSSVAIEQYLKQEPIQQFRGQSQASMRGDSNRLIMTDQQIQGTGRGTADFRALTRLSQPDRHDTSDTADNNLYQESIISMRGKKRNSAMIDDSLEYQKHRSQTVLDQRLDYNSNSGDVFNNMMLNKTRTTATPSSIRDGIMMAQNQSRSSSLLNKMKVKSQGQGTIVQSKAAIEIRLINNMKQNMDKKENQIYERHGLKSQLIINGAENHLYDLVEHPQWQELTYELQAIYLTTLEDFNEQLICQNYFIRSDIHNNRNQQRPLKSKLNSNNNKATNRQSEFVATFAARLDNLFQQHQRLTIESKKQLNHLKEENTRLEREMETMRLSHNNIKDAQAVIDAIVNQYFSMGQDADAKALRLREAEQFLKTPTLQQLMDSEGFNLRDPKIEQAEYSNVLSRLQEVCIAMQLPSSHNNGVYFDMTDHKFDPDFSGSIKKLFSDPVKSVQFDCALRALKMVHKDTVFHDVCIQANEGEIDNDLITEVQFYRTETARLSGELNLIKVKLRQQERDMKATSKEKNEALLAVTAFDKSLKETRQDAVRDSNLLAHYKIMHTEDVKQNDQLSLQIGKMQIFCDRLKRNDKVAEKLVDKLSIINSRRQVVITELDSILNGLEIYCNADQTKQITQVRSLQKKVDAKDLEVKKAVLDFGRRDYHNARQNMRKFADKKDSVASKDNDGDVNNKDGSMAGGVDQELIEYERQKNQTTPTKKTPTRAPKKKKSIQQTSESPKKQAKQSSKGAASIGSSGKSQKNQPQKPKIQEVIADYEEAVDALPIFMRQSARVPKDMELLDREPWDQSKYAKSEPSDSQDDVEDGDFARGNDDGKSHMSEGSVNLTHEEIIQDQFSDQSRRIRESDLKKEELSKSNEIKAFQKQKTKVYHHQSTQQSVLKSDHTEHLSSLGLARSNDNLIEMEKVPTFDQKIIINRSHGDGKNKADTGVQTETELFFKYIFNYLHEVERRLSSGEISADKIMQLGRQALQDDANMMHQGSYNKSSDPQFHFSINELKECLKKLKGLGSQGGNAFFAGLARAMVAAPIIPPNHDYSVLYKKDKNIASTENEAKAVQAFLEASMKDIKKMTKVKNSAGGGGGAVRNPPSPTKAQKAAGLINNSYLK